MAKKKQRTKTTVVMDLPDECWEMIFSCLHPVSWLEPISLVSKRFYSLTNRLHSALTIAPASTSPLPRLLHRFPSLKKIDLSAFLGCGGCADLDLALAEIARSGLAIEALDVSHQPTLPLRGLREIGSSPSMRRSFKSLKCSNIAALSDHDLVAAADSLPWLEELDFSNPNNPVTSLSHRVSSRNGATDAGIEQLSGKLTSLRKINLSRNHQVSDRSLVSLSLNCASLREIKVQNCFVTRGGIGFVLRHCSNLTYISYHQYCDPPPYPPWILKSPVPTFAPETSIAFATSVTVVKFYSMDVPDSLFSAIAEAPLPLKKLTLSYCRGFTLPGISSLLRAISHSLEALNLSLTDLLTDACMVELSESLHNLRSVNLNHCSHLTGATFLTLASNCPKLQEIKMRHMRRLGHGKSGVGGADVSVVKNPQIQCLALSCSKKLNDSSLRGFGLVCPNLRWLDVGFCPCITVAGVVQILKACPGLTHLIVCDYPEVNTDISGMGLGNYELKLEVLEAGHSGINDPCLALIAKTCPNLLRLDLKGCWAVSDKGVKQVLRKCKHLKRVNLWNCERVSDGFEDWVQSTRPWLKDKVIFVPG